MNVNIKTEDGNLYPANIAGADGIIANYLQGLHEGSGEPYRFEGTANLYLLGVQDNANNPNQGTVIFVNNSDDVATVKRGYYSYGEWHYYGTLTVQPHTYAWGSAGTIFNNSDILVAYNTIGKTSEEVESWAESLLTGTIEEETVEVIIPVIWKSKYKTESYNTSFTINVKKTVS